MLASNLPACSRYLNLEGKEYNAPCTSHNVLQDNQGLDPEHVPTTQVVIAVADSAQEGDHRRTLQADFGDDP